MCNCRCKHAMLRNRSVFDLCFDDINNEAFRGVVKLNGGVEALRLLDLLPLLLLLAEFLEMRHDLVLQALVPCPCPCRRRRHQRAGARDGYEIGAEVERVHGRDGEQGGCNLGKGRGVTG